MSQRKFKVRKWPILNQKFHCARFHDFGKWSSILDSEDSSWESNIWDSLNNLVYYSWDSLDQVFLYMTMAQWPNSLSIGQTRWLSKICVRPSSWIPVILHQIILATCLQILFSYQSGFHIFKFLKYQSLIRFTYQKNKNDYKTEILGNFNWNQGSSRRRLRIRGPFHWLMIA